MRNRPASRTFFVAVLIVAAITGCTGQRGTLEDVCVLIDLEDGPIQIDGFTDAVRYYESIGEAARNVGTPELDAIASRFTQMSKALEETEQGGYRNFDDPEFMEAVENLDIGELLRICIDAGLIDERFRDGLPG